ncbi:MAG: hypothetical protein ACI8SE_000373 [Bacteroidia bacterium]|jgi:hypothetical protein
MKKLTILTLTCLLLGSLTCSAQIFAGQDILITQTEGMPTKQLKFEVFIPSDTDVNRVLRKTNEGYFVINYDASMQPVGKPIPYNVIPKEARVLAFEEFAGELIIFYTLSPNGFFDKELLLAVVDGNDLSTIITPSKLFDLNFRSNYFHYEISPDKNKMAVIQFNPSGDEQQLLVMEMFDDLEFEDPYELSMPDATKIYKLDFWLTNEGDIFFEGLTYTDEEDYRDRTTIYNRYEISSDEVVTTSFTVENVGPSLSSGGHIVKRNGNVVFYCAYTNEEDDYNGIKGISYVEYNGIKGISYVEYNGITGDLIAENDNDLEPSFFYVKEPQKPDAAQRSVYSKLNNKGLSVKIRGCEEKVDGTVVMITESSWIYNWDTEQQSGTKLSLFDVSVISFNEEGHVDWTQKIEKAQYTMEWTSIVRPPYDLDWKKLTHYKMIDDNLHFFFIVNGYGMPGLNLTKASPYDSYNSSHLAHVRVSMIDGKKSVQSLGVMQKKQFVPKFKSFSDLNNGRITFKSFTKKEVRLGVVTFE